MDKELLADWHQLQEQLAFKVIQHDQVTWSVDKGPLLQLVGGLDTSFLPAAAAANAEQGCSERAVACLTVLTFPGLEVVHADFAPLDLTIPYIPGYLGMREVPAYRTLLDRVHRTALDPQVVLVDGCGVLHPRGCGAASQLGAESGYATIGVSKNLLAVDGLDRFDVRAAFAALAIDGSRTPQAWQAREASARASATQHTHGLGLSHAHTPAPAHPQLHADSCEHRETGTSLADNRTAEGAVSGHSQSALSHLQGDSALLRTHACLTRDRQVPLRGSSGSIWGMALCPGTTSKPIYVSVGHRLSLATCASLVLRCCKHRIPEPIRQADLRSREWLRQHVEHTPQHA